MSHRPRCLAGAARANPEIRRSTLALQYPARAMKTSLRVVLGNLEQPRGASTTSSHPRLEMCG